MAGKRTYEHRHMITRTVTTTSGKVLYFNQATKSQEVTTVTLNGKLDEDAFMKKAAAQVDGIVCMVEDVTTDQTLYGATLEDFLSVATVIE
jgi:hypothetical protein